MHEVVKLTSSATVRQAINICRKNTRINKKREEERNTIQYIHEQLNVIKMHCCWCSVVVVVLTAELSGVVQCCTSCY